MEHLCSAYIHSLMNYIEMEYDNIPSEVTEEMEAYFMDCFRNDPPTCFPNAAGMFWERFLRKSDIL